MHFKFDGCYLYGSRPQQPQVQRPRAQQQVRVMQ